MNVHIITSHGMIIEVFDDVEVARVYFNHLRSGRPDWDWQMRAYPLRSGMDLESLIEA